MCQSTAQMYGVVAQSKKGVRLAQDGEVVSMQHGADNCTGQLLRARKVLGWPKTGWWCQRTTQMIVWGSCTERERC